MTQFFIAIGSIFAFAGVLARSLSAHALLQLLQERGKLANFNLASDYLLIHGLTLIVIALLCHLFPSGKYQRAGWAFIVGSLLFQGSVLIKSFVSIQPLGFVTPLGGFILMLGWFLLLLAAVMHFWSERNPQ